jgi:hypothetical protein
MASSRTRVSKRSPSATRSRSSSSSGDNGLSKCLFDFSHMLSSCKQITCTKS